MKVSILGATIVAIALPVLFGMSLQQTRSYGPYASGSPDSGTCGNFWADDLFDRTFKVDIRQRPDGSYDVVEQFKNGTFITRAGHSPGGCEGGNTNPAQVPAGINGRMQGQFWIRVSNGVFNSNANPGSGTTAQFIASVFGPSATYVVYSFSLNYNAKNRGDWKNASRDKGGNSGNIN